MIWAGRWRSRVRQPPCSGGCHVTTTRAGGRRGACARHSRTVTGVRGRPPEHDQSPEIRPCPPAHALVVRSWSAVGPGSVASLACAPLEASGTGAPTASIPPPTGSHGRTVRATGQAAEASLRDCVLRCPACFGHARSARFVSSYGSLRAPRELAKEPRPGREPVRGRRSCLARVQGFTPNDRGITAGKEECGTRHEPANDHTLASATPTTRATWPQAGCPCDEYRARQSACLRLGGGRLQNR